jgi:exopolysaccharide production protein ExoY
MACGGAAAIGEAPRSEMQLPGQAMSVSQLHEGAYGAAPADGALVRAARAKRLFDLAVTLMALPVTAVIIAMLYLLTRLDGGPGFFGHVRVGRHDQDFRCWKIRTMVPDAEAVLKTYLAQNPAAAEEWARDFKLTDDPRVTRLGRFLRASSLDELPQIWNVLRGEMSLVGPRPITRSEMARYAGREWCYLSVKPGITGMWQVSGRNDVSYDTRVQLDMQYLRAPSMRQDLGIILRTCAVVLTRTGR